MKATEQDAATREWSPGEFQRFIAARATPLLAPKAAALRVNQLDARQLENELVSVLKQQFSKIFTMFESGIAERWQAEVDMGICFFIFLCTVWRDIPLPGDKLQNLRYQSVGAGGRARWYQKMVYALLAIGSRWAWSRVSAASTAQSWAERPEGDWHRRMYRAMSGLESAVRAAALFNFLAFLRTGRYRGLAERASGLRLVPAQPGAQRRISFEFMNRQMVWSEFSELLLFVLPLVNFARLRSFLLPRLWRAGGTPDSRADLFRDGCGLCGAEAEAVSMAHVASPCGHVFCYYCIRSSLAGAGKTPVCPRCRAPVVSCSRYVLEATSPARDDT